MIQAATWIQVTKPALTTQPRPLESDFNYDDWLFFHGGLQYDASKKDLQFANGAIEYREGGTYSQA